jgi:hypothetical protein
MPPGPGDELPLIGERSARTGGRAAGQSPPAPAAGRWAA